VLLRPVEDLAEAAAGLPEGPILRPVDGEVDDGGP